MCEALGTGPVNYRGASKGNSGIIFFFVEFSINLEQIKDMEEKGLYRRFIVYIKTKFYGWILRSKDDIMEKLDPKPVLSNKQKTMIRIVKSMTTSPNSILFYSPLSGTRYVSLNGIHLKIDSTLEDGVFVELVNGRFIHHVGFPERTIREDIIESFDIEAEKRRKDIDSVMWEKASAILEQTILDIENS